MSELDLLRRLGEELAPPPLAELRATARRRDRQRSGLLVGTAALAVAVVTLGTLLVGPGDGGAPEPAPSPDGGSTTRPLTWAEGTTIHLGGDTVEAAGPVEELDLTDDGVAFRTADGRLWFSDGSGAEQLGTLRDPGPGYGDDSWPLLWQPSWMASGNAGSRLMWFEFARPGQPEAVVYDTLAGEVVTRTAVELDQGSWTAPYSVDEQSAYWFLDPDELADSNVPQVRLDLATGAQERISEEDYLAGLGTGSARTFEISHAEKGFRLAEVNDGAGWNFSISKDRVEPSGMQPLTVVDGLTRARMEFQAPYGYGHTDTVWLTQWLDDDTVVLLAETRGGEDLLVCDVGKACEVTVSGDDLVAPETN
jgi:hypothetical protein